MSLPDPEQTVRIFFALWPGVAEQAALAAWQPPLKQPCKGRATRADKLHATLVFLGNVAAERVAEAQAAAQLVHAPAFALNWDQLRYWGHNHIVFAAPFVMPQALAQLVLQLEENLLQRGFEFDRRSFQGHVTLIRNARCGHADLPAVAPVVWNIREFALVQSVNAEEGVRYEVLARFPLGDAPAPE